MRKYNLQFWASLISLFLIFFVFIPRATVYFAEQKQKREIAENEQRLQREKLAREAAEKKAKWEAEEKMYLTGHFDPAQKQNFSPVPEKYNIGGYKMYLRKEALEAFLNMAETAEKENVKLTVTSATRNFNQQKNLWNKKWEGLTLVDGKKLTESFKDEKARFEKILEYSAVPGTSRHHWGTELDINGVDPKYFDIAEGEKVYEWLVKNAPSFGFCQTYTEKGPLRPTGYNEEKWHWSYLPLSRKFTQEYRDLITDQDIKGFDGDTYAMGENLIANYVLGINPECL